MFLRSGVVMSRRENLESEGWELQSVLSEPRLSEAVELYERIGYEVKVLPFDPNEECTECTECFKECMDTIFVVYTRRKKETNDAQNG